MVLLKPLDFEDIRSALPLVNRFMSPMLNIKPLPFHLDTGLFSVQLFVVHVRFVLCSTSSRSICS